MDADQRLHAARKATMDGRHAEALADFLWYHHHALEENPAQYGVRRSFALSYWKELADVYPQALQAMEDERDRCAQALLDGAADIEAFRDVEAINSKLGVTALTHQLYVKLTAVRPELARQCARQALPAVVEAEDYQLASELLGDPGERIAQDVAHFNRNLRSLQGRAFTRAPIRWAYTSHCTADIRLVLSILEGCARSDEARQIKAQALALIQSPSARRTVNDFLLHPHKAQPPRPTKRELRQVRRLHENKSKS
jgi:hypothetical protein